MGIFLATTIRRYPTKPTRNIEKIKKRCVIFILHPPLKKSIKLKKRLDLCPERMTVKLNHELLQTVLGDGAHGFFKWGFPKLRSQAVSVPIYQTKTID